MPPSCHLQRLLPLITPLGFLPPLLYPGTPLKLQRRVQSRKTRVRRTINRGPVPFVHLWSLLDCVGKYFSSTAPSHHRRRAFQLHLTSPQSFQNPHVAFASSYLTRSHAIPVPAKSANSTIQLYFYHVPTYFYFLWTFFAFTTVGR